MTLEQFLLRIQMGCYEKPENISQVRWNGMLTYYEFNYRLDDEIQDYMNGHP